MSTRLIRGKYRIRKQICRTSMQIRLDIPRNYRKITDWKYCVMEENDKEIYLSTWYEMDCFVPNHSQTVQFEFGWKIDLKFHEHKAHSG